MTKHRDLGIWAVVASCFLFAPQADSGGPQAVSVQKIVTGPGYSYSCSDISSVVVRSNHGQPMTDFMPLAGGSCLAGGATLTIRNDDPRAALALYGTLVQSPHGIMRGYNASAGLSTFVEGGVLFGGGCANCLSVTFLEPGATRAFAYDDGEATYPNGTAGGVEGGTPRYDIRAKIWRLRGGTRVDTPTHALSATPVRGPMWVAYPQTACCTCVPNIALWGTLWSACNSGRDWSLNIAHRSKQDQIVRLELRNGDRWWNDVHRGAWAIDRTLINSATSVFTIGQTFWSAWSQMWECAKPVGSDGVAIGSYWLAIESIHSRDGSVVPVETELLPGGYLALNLRTEGGSHEGYNFIGTRPWTASCGHWHDFVREVKIDPASGFLREWMDGRLAVDFTGPLGHAGDTPYQQFQLYRANYSDGANSKYPGPANTYAERIANFQFGTVSLAGRIARPMRMP